MRTLLLGERAVVTASALGPGALAYRTVAMERCVFRIRERERRCRRSAGRRANSADHVASRAVPQALISIG